MFPGVLHFKDSSQKSMYGGASGFFLGVQQCALCVSSPVSLTVFWLPFRARGQTFPSQCRRTNIWVPGGCPAPTAHRALRKIPLAVSRAAWLRGQCPRVWTGCHMVLVVQSMQPLALPGTPLPSRGGVLVLRVSPLLPRDLVRRP